MLTAGQQFLLWVAGWPLAAVCAGLIGLRFRRLRQLLMWPACAYSLLILGYGLFRGGPNECVENAAATGYTCHPTAAFADLSLLGVVVIGAVTLLSVAPIVAGRAHSRAPSFVATVILVLLILVFTFDLLFWIPAASAVLASAIAGPPDSTSVHKERGAPDEEPLV
jgi:hypothetical protein